MKAAAELGVPHSKPGNAWSQEKLEQASRDPPLGFWLEQPAGALISPKGY